MPHVYASVADANEYLKSSGSTTFATEAAPIVALKLQMLAAVSRRIDDVCYRSAFGSGFGPRLGINYYDGDGTNILNLRDDVQTLPTLLIAPATGVTPVTATLTTDYHLTNAIGYTGPPWRRVVLHQRGTPTVFATGIRTISTPSTTWGHSDVTLPTTTTVASGLSVGTTATSFVTSVSPDLSPGMTLLIGTEQLYLYALSGTTATVVRGVNGTTAATHADASAIARYTYDDRVRETTLRLWQRRWRARDAGADGTDGALGAAGTGGREGEDTIIRRSLSELTMLGQY